jgi:hypothetical protein
MEARYAVFTPGAFMGHIHVEGDLDTVVAWLRNGTFGYKVLDREENKVMDADYFMTKVGERKCLSENDIRRIIREELSAFLDSAGKKASVPEYMKTEKMEDALVSIIKTVAENEANEVVNKHEDGFDHTLS